MDYDPQYIASYNPIYHQPTIIHIHKNIPNTLMVNIPKFTDYHQPPTRHPPHQPPMARPRVGSGAVVRSSKARARRRISEVATERQRGPGGVSIGLGKPTGDHGFLPWKYRV